jgi:hypothetical protein
MDDPAQQPVTTAPPNIAPIPPVPTPVPPPSLTYEETPEIPFVPPESIAPSTPPLPAKKTGQLGRTFGVLIAFIAFFIIGLYASNTLRRFLPSQIGSEENQTQSSPTPSTSIASPAASWNTYDVISGVTKKAVSGVSFQLPPDVLSPICDGTSCASQGTYLPNGTRLTVAARGTGQSLRDFRGTVISDANGVPIPTKQLTITKFTATEYESSGSGRTISGYAFSHIRGVMIPLSDTLSLELNHFAPVGITADFEKDDILFDEIVKTVTVQAIAPTTIPVSTSASGLQ